MHPALVKLVAMLLLFVQGVVALAPGQVLCIPVRDCGTHERGIDAECSHCDAAPCSTTAGEPLNSEHGYGPYSPALHPIDECGCHVHVPVPGDEQVPSNPRGENPDLRAFFIPVLIAVVLNWDCETPQEVVPRFHPPDFSASDQVLALKATHLLI